MILKVPLEILGLTLVALEGIPHKYRSVVLNFLVHFVYTRNVHNVRVTCTIIILDILHHWILMLGHHDDTRGTLYCFLGGIWRKKFDNDCAG